MSLSCKIIEDLLPLFADGVCSEESSCAVKSHLEHCEKCKKLIENQNVSIFISQPDKAKEERAVARSFKLIRIRWLISIILVVLLIPACILGWGQIKGSGIHFTNLRELWIGNAFIRQLQNSNYEDAYQYMDIYRIEDEWLENWFDKDTLSNIEQDGLDMFCKSAELLREVGGVQRYEYIGINKGVNSYSLVYSVYIDSEEHLVTLEVSDSGIRNFSCEGSFLEDPFAHFAMWSEYLWQQYEGCYYDPETKQYHYYKTD